MKLTAFADELEKVAFFGFGLSPEVRAYNERVKLLNLPHNVAAFNVELERTAKKTFKKPLKDLDDPEWTAAFTLVNRDFKPTPAAK